MEILHARDPRRSTAPPCDEVSTQGTGRRGDLNADEFRRQFPMGAVEPELEPVLSNVEHFFSDADIRLRDVRYKEMQEARMAHLISLLRLGDVANAGIISFLRR